VENFLTSLKVVTPLILMMVTGYISKRAKILDSDLVRKINNLVFRIFLPALLFRQIYALDPGKDINLYFIAYSMSSLAVVIILSFFIVPIYEKDRKKAGVVIQALYRGNFILFGFAISYSLYGESAMGPTSVLVALCVPIFNIVSVVILGYFRQSKPNLKGAFLDVIKTPCVIAAIAAALGLVLGVEIPETFMGALQDVGNVTMPLALILTGATFTIKGFVRYRTHILLVSLLKLLIIPVVVLGAGAILGFRNESLVALLSMMATPIAVSAVPTAEMMGSDGELSAQLTIATSALCVVTLFLLILGLKSFSLI